MDDFQFIPPRSKTTYSCYFLEEDASAILVLTMYWKVYQRYHYSLNKCLLWIFVVHGASLCEESTVPLC